MLIRLLVFASIIPWAVRVAAVIELCGKYQAYTSRTDKNYTFNNNAWAEDDSGSVCTYVSEDARSFYSLWTWPSNPPRVHAFPHVGLNSDLLPAVLEDISSLNVSLAWSMSPVSLIEGASTDPSAPPDLDALSANDVQANVAFDFFADADPNNARQPREQKYEFMIWLGKFGDATQPLGMSSPNDPPIIVTIDEIYFTLYNGTNSNGQSVYSWVANTTVTTLDTDISPLLRYLATEGFVPPSLYLGVIQFGTETFHADSQINFTVNAFAANLSKLDGSVADSTRDQLPSATQIVTSRTAGSSAQSLHARDAFALGSAVKAGLLALWVFISVVAVI